MITMTIHQIFGSMFGFQWEWESRRSWHIPLHIISLTLNIETVPGSFLVFLVQNGAHKQQRKQPFVSSHCCYSHSEALGQPKNQNSRLPRH